jgi:tetratricopeptide (TPR) repeat protein
MSATPTSAIAYYNQVLTFQPGHARAHYNLGLIHHMQGKVGEAIMSFERAMFHAPEYSDAHREMAALLLGLNLREEAIEAYQRGLKGNPHDDMTLALLLHQQGAHLRLGRHGALSRSFARAGNGHAGGLPLGHVGA